MEDRFSKVISESLTKLSYDNIRPYQYEVVKNYVLFNKDVFFSAPTGSGKSLVFEIAPLVLKAINNLDNCTVIVVSPLVSLMRSQSANLRKKNIKALFLKDILLGQCSTSNVEEDFLNLTLSDVKRGEVDILFASPESLLDHQRGTITELSQRGLIKALFVDEAHCIPKYGKPDKTRKTEAYRPCYGRLGELRSIAGKNVPVIAMTATATPGTKSVILKDLCMENCHEVVLNPNKENITYWVVPVNGDDAADNFQWLVKLLFNKGISTPRMLIFFRQIKHIVDVYELLETELGKAAYINFKENGPNDDRNRLFDMFHLKTDDDVKDYICSSYADPDGNIRVVLCSTSFSMGLDVKGVDLVIHYGPANDISDYLQETGRAGRDQGTKCHAILMKYKRCSGRNVSNNMKEFITTSECRRKVIMNDLEQKFTPKQPFHLCCDHCQKKCTCNCKCEVDCSCLDSCEVNNPEVLKLIMENQNEEENNSTSDDDDDDSELELIHKKPQILLSSDDET